MISFTKHDKKYGCFSNFYGCPVKYDGIQYKNSEAAWQAQKVIDEDKKEHV